MTPGPVVRRLFLIVAIVLLLALAWTGISGGISQLSQTHTSGQMAQTMMQLGYGSFAALSVVTTFWAQRWNRLLLACWVVATSFAAGMASVVWGDTSAFMGFVSGAAACLVALGIAWLLHTGAPQ